MKIGDLVKALDGEIKGMLGVITRVEDDPARHAGNPTLASIFWNDGDHQNYVSTKYLEVVQKND